MKKTYAAALLALTLCLSALPFATGAAQITAPTSAVGFAVPEVIDRLAEEYGAPPQIAGVEKTSDTEYRIRFDGSPYGVQGAKTSACRPEVMLEFKEGYGSPQNFSAKAFEDGGLTCVVEVDPGLTVEPTVEFAWNYVNVRIDGETVTAYKYLHCDLEGNPLSMYIDINPLSYRFEYVDGAPVLVEYTDDEYRNTGEQIVAHYVSDTGVLMRYDYSFYVGDAGKDPAGIVHLTYSGYGELKGADCSPIKKRTVLYEWDMERKQWYLEAAPGKTDGERDYDADLPDYVPDPTTIAPPVVAAKPEGFGDFDVGEFFGVPDVAVPMTAAEGAALGVPLPFEVNALPKTVSCEEEDGGLVMQLAWDEREAVRAALGESGAISGKASCYYQVKDERYGTVWRNLSGEIDLETLSARIEAPEGSKRSEGDYSLRYDVQTPGGSAAIRYYFWSEDGETDAQFSDIFVVDGGYTRMYTPDGRLYGVEINYGGDGSRVGNLTCYYDEAGALDLYDYTPTPSLLAEFNADGLSSVEYHKWDEAEGSIDFAWTPDGGWSRERWDEETEDFISSPCEAPDGVDPSLMTPLI